MAGNIVKKKIAIIGSNGQLGTDLVRELSKDTGLLITPLTHTNIEILDTLSIKKALDKVRADYIINTAAYTRVDEAEAYPEKAYAINAIGTKNLVDYCRSTDTGFVLFSTDYVFGQDKKRRTPYKESDTPEPINTYGISKLAGEQYVQAHLKKFFIIRTTGLFGVAGSSGKGYNFIELMLRLAKEQKTIKVVGDQVSSPTYTKELAMQTALLLKTGKFGLYHITSHGSCSWYDFAQEIFNRTNQKVKLKPVTEKDWKTPAKRPGYSVLENEKLRKMDIDIMSSWKTGLQNYLAEKGHI